MVFRHIWHASTSIYVGFTFYVCIPAKTDLPVSITHVLGTEYDNSAKDTKELIATIFHESGQFRIIAALFLFLNK